MYDLDYYSWTQGILYTPELQPKNLWVLSFNSDTNSLDFPNKDFLIQSTNLPLFSLNLDKTSFDLILPESKENYGDFTFSFYETISFEGFNWCYDWITSIYDFDKRLFKKNFHKKKRNAVLRFIKILNPLNVTQLVGVSLLSNAKIYQTMEFDIQGIMIKSIGDLDLDNDSGDPLSFDTTLEIQQIKPISGLKSIQGI